MPAIEMPTDAQVRGKAAEVAAVASAKYLQPFQEARDLSMSMAGQSSSVPGGAIPVPIPVDWEAAVALAGIIATDITAQFEWFTRPDPVVVQSMMSTLMAIRGEHNLNPIINPLVDSRPGLIQNLWEAVDGWHGNAATAFKQNYLARFESKRANHIMLVIELALHLQTFQGIIANARAKIIEIGEQARLRLEALPDSGLSDAVLLTIASGVAGLLGAAIPQAAVPLAFLGGGLGVAAQWADEHAADPPQTYIQGATVEDVVRSMKDAIVLLKRDVANAQELLNRAIAHDDGLVALEKSKADIYRDHNNYFFLIRPEVIGALGGPDTDLSC